MKSNNKGLQMSRMGQGALGPEGRRAADVQSEWGSPHGDSNGRAHSRSGSFRQSEKRELSLHPDEKGALRG